MLLAHAEAHDTPGDTRPIISIRDVTYDYPNGTRALAGLSLEIGRAGVYGIVGPSGCGKSTLLHLIAGLSAPRSGVIDRRHAPGAAHPLTMVFQKDTLLPWLTVARNVALYFRFHSAPRAEVQERVTWLLALAGLSDAANAYPYQLSGGMRRRVAFLAAVAPLPELVLLDEPFSSLDEPTRVAIHQDVHAIVRRLGITVLIVTHDLAEALSLCDEVAILTRGPGRVAARHTVPFGTDRQMLALRQSPEFLRLYGLLWEDLSRQISAEKSG